MAKAHHLDNMIITHYYTIICCICMVPYSNFESWERVEVIEWMVLFSLGLCGTLG